MKNVIKLIAISIVFYCCKTESKKSDYTILSGEIENAKNASIYIRNNHYKLIDTLKVVNGKFTDTLNLKKGYYYLMYNDRPLPFFIKPNYNLNINFDNDNFYSSIKFTGDGEKENNYLREKNKLRESFPMSQVAYNFYATLSEEDFLKQSDSIYNAYKQLFEKNKNLDNDFSYLEKNSIDIDNAIRIVQFEEQKQIVENNPNFKVSENYPNPFTKTDLNNPKLLVTYRYKDLMHSYFNRKTSELKKDNKNLDFFVAYLEQLANSNIDSEIIDLLGLEVSKYGFTYTKDLNKFYNTYLSFAKTDKYIKSFKEAYNKKRSEKGQKSADFSFEGIDGKTYELNDFKGKYIYIDIWASWCTPCIKQIPYLKKLEEKYHNKINFVSIAWNDDKPSWKKMLKKQDLKGIQLYASDKNAEFFKFYGVSGIPRFILLDKEGKIIESTAKQPSEESLDKQLSELE